MTDVSSRPAPEPSGSGAGPDAEADRAARELALGTSSLAAHLVLIAVWLAGTFLLYQEVVTYNLRSRAFPLWTFAAMTVLVLVRLIQVVRAARRYGAKGPSRERFLHELVMIGWLIVAWVLVALIGLIPGSIALLAAYLLVHRTTTLVRTAIIIAVVFVVVRLIFVEVLNLPLQPGILF